MAILCTPGVLFVASSKLSARKLNQNGTKYTNITDRDRLDNTSALDTKRSLTLSRTGETNVVLGMTHHPLPRRSIDSTYHQLETVRGKHITVGPYRLAKGGVESSEIGIFCETTK